MCWWIASCDPPYAAMARASKASSVVNVARSLGRTGAGGQGREGQALTVAHTQPHTHAQPHAHPHPRAHSDPHAESRRRHRGLLDQRWCRVDGDRSRVLRPRTLALQLLGLRGDGGQLLV